MAIIKDGTGNGYEAEVDSKGRLRGRTVTLNSSDSAAINEGLYFTSAQIEATDANESVFFYLQNNENSDILVSRWSVRYGVSVGGTDNNFYINYYINPTGGTMLTSGTPSAAINLNIGSNKSLDASFIIDPAGNNYTLTGADAVLPIMQPVSTAGVNIDNQLPAIVIPKGKSVGISVVPPTGNTSLVINTTFELVIVENI